MLKELFVAIILGALLGFGLTGGYFSLIKNSRSNSLPPAPTSTPEISTSPQNNNQSTSPTPANGEENPLTIDSPENESVVSNSKITIKGSTAPQSNVVAITPKGTYTTKANTSGSFNFEVDIDSGANIISVTSVSNNDTAATSEVLVTYSTAKF